MNLKIQNLSLSFGEKKIFDIKGETEINCGEILIVKGKNGSGKTSFLKSLAGFFSFSEEQKENNEENLYFQKNYGEFFLSGKILCESKNISEFDEEYFYTRSFLPANFEFCDEFDVKFYLKFWDKINSNEIQEKKIDSVIKYFGFEKYLENEICEISSGWKKRLHLSKLFFENRAAWILDEPLNFLDEDGVNLFIGMINSKILSGGIVIFSDHIGRIDQLINISANNIKYLEL
jgi:ABC-type transport system involved in cytochrome c biogenesis ATPase subunit